MEIHDIVKKLVGPINPIGETNTDNERFHNLKVMTELVDDLLTEIDDVAYYNKDRQEYSIKRAANYASKFYDKIGIKE